jgi:hypothetical protein
MSKSKKINDQGFNLINKALLSLTEVPPPEEGFWDKSRGAFLAQARQFKAQPVSQSSPARLKSWAAGFVSMLSLRIPARKEINMTSLATIFITLSAIFALAIGGVDAAQSSLPGTPLYTLKSNWESVQLSLTNDPYALAERSITNATSRVQEAIGLAGSSRDIPTDLALQYQASLNQALQAASGLDESKRSQLLNHINTQLALHQQLLSQEKSQIQNRSVSAQNQLALMLKTAQQTQEQVRLRINQGAPSQPPAGDQNQLQYKNNNQNQNQNQIQNQNGDQDQEPLQNQFQLQLKPTEQSQENNLNMHQNHEQEEGQQEDQNHIDMHDGKNNKGGDSSGGK